MDRTADDADCNDSAGLAGFAEDLLVRLLAVVRRASKAPRGFLARKAIVAAARWLRDAALIQHDQEMPAGAQKKAPLQPG